MNTPRPEHDILICVARRELSPIEASTLRRLSNSVIDWEYLLATARRHALLPLLHKHISIAFGDNIPTQFRATLKREAVTNAQTTLHLIGKALRIQKLLGEHEISCALFKGPLLSELAYGEVGMRPAGDIDLLIRKDDFARAKQLLESMDYQMYPQLTPAQQASHLSFHCEIQFVRDDWFTIIDLHWELTPRTFVFGLSGEEVMSRLQTITLAGTPAQTFSSADLILYLAMHGAKHLWRRLEWIASFAEVVRSLDSSAWSEVVERTLKARAKRILGLGLRLVENIYHIAIPPEVLSTLDVTGEMKALAKKISDEMFDVRAIPESSDTNIFNLKIMDRKRDALASTLRAVFVPTLSDWQALSLPDAMHPLYYLFRPVRLSRTYSVSLLRRLAHKPAQS